MSGALVLQLRRPRIWLSFLLEGFRSASILQTNQTEKHDKKKRMQRIWREMETLREFFIAEFIVANYQTDNQLQGDISCLASEVLKKQLKK